MKTMLKLLMVSLVLVWAFTGCSDDDDKTSPYTSLTLNVSYKTLGVSKAFANKPVVTLTNLTEQSSRTEAATEMGKLVLTDLLPGNYSISVRTTLTPEEAKDLGFDVANSVKINLAGNIASLALALNQDMTTRAVELTESIQSALVIKEIYYAGCPSASGTAIYRNDQFYVIYNNSDAAVSLDNIYIGHAESFVSKPAPWDGEDVSNPQHVYVNSAWKIVKTGSSATLEPGKQIVIAAMAANHKGNADLNPNSPVDLSGADYEAYASGFSNNTNVDYPAANMEDVFVLTLPGHRLWLASFQGTSTVIFEATAAEFAQMKENYVTAPESVWDIYDLMDEWDEPYKCLKVSNKMVVDAVDLIPNSSSLENKRFGAELDGGYATCPSKEGKSVIRKQAETVEGRVVYADTNNSKDDFEVNETPLK